MYSSDELDLLIQEAMTSLGMENKVEKNNKSYSRNKNSSKKGKPALSTAQALVIAGILGGSLSVESVLVDANQEINIVLTGSLKRKSDNNNKLDSILDQLGNVPFDDVVAAMLRRLGR